jgi:cyclic pyranopterin phosphate synthase
MTGHQLSLDMVKRLLDDAAQLGVHTVRLYGGEPLLHRDLSKMVRHCVDIGIKPYLTTNGILLGQKADELYEAGLRTITIGFYGTGESYNAYVQTKRQFERLDQSVAYVREKYGDAMDLQINFLLMRPTCSLQALHEAWNFAERYRTDFHVDLIHYSLPYFTEGPERVLQFQADDRPDIESVVDELITLRGKSPGRFKEPVMSLRAIPDWLLQGPNMRVPCDAYNLLWIGPDGTVQLCYVTFKLGNLHDQSLHDLLYTHAHRQAARNAFELACPNCHCERQSRIEKHLPSRLRYGSEGRQPAVLAPALAPIVK